tara:strand:- start:271 stop:744 length:474 start_codon:yes stop_codon:yes gene_type:complete
LDVSQITEWLDAGHRAWKSILGFCLHQQHCLMRSLIVLLGLSLTGMSLAVSAEPMPLFLQKGQSILNADQKLLAKGWHPAPASMGQLQALNQADAVSRLLSLKSCSGSGVGYCRYEYQQPRHRLVLITVPGSKRDRFARLVRWWMEPLNIDAGHCLQ